MDALARLQAVAAVLATGAWLVAALPAPANAQGPARPIGDEARAHVLTGALARVRQRGIVRIGYRESAVPFSVGVRDAPPYGYTIDLCLAVVEQIVETVGVRAVRIEYLPVTPSDRIERVVRGDIDLECGATSITAQRRREVAFSPIVFLTGTKLAVRRDSGLRSRRDFGGRTIAVARGTTNEEAIRQVIARERLDTRVVTTDDVPQAFALLADRNVDAVASDEVLLLGFLAEHGLRGEYAVVGEFLSFDAYGIMFARDDQALADEVEAALRRLAETRELRWIYHRWFLRPLPSGVRLGLPMSPQLERSFELLGLPPE